MQAAIFPERREGRPPIAGEDGYIIVLLSDPVPNELWVDGRRLASPAPPGTTVELKVGPATADPGSPPDTLKFYVPRVVVPELADESALDRADGISAPSKDAVFDAVVARF